MEHPGFEASILGDIISHWSEHWLECANADLAALQLDQQPPFHEVAFGPLCAQDFNHGDYPTLMAAIEECSGDLTQVMANPILKAVCDAILIPVNPAKAFDLDFQQGPRVTFKRQYQKFFTCVVRLRVARLSDSLKRTPMDLQSTVLFLKNITTLSYATKDTA
jgi:hypothetical protein